MKYCKHIYHNISTNVSLINCKENDLKDAMEIKELEDKPSGLIPTRER
jgi:hypothetical protein